MQKQFQPQTTNNSNVRDASVQISTKGHTAPEWKVYSMGIDKEGHEEFSIESDWGIHAHAFSKEEANLIAAAPELLAELEAAEQIILAMLNVMTQEQKTAADEKLTLAGVSTGGMTRYHERRAAIAKARGQ